MAAAVRKGPSSNRMRRRCFIRLAATGVAGAAVGVSLSGCGESSPDDPGPDEDRREQPAPAAGGSVLLAYFSLPGENYWNGGRRNLRVGNTEVLAEMIADRLDCDVHRIRAADPYSEDYDETVQRNVRDSLPNRRSRSG